MSDTTIEVIEPSYMINVETPYYIIDVNSPSVIIESAQPTQVIEVIVPTYAILIGGAVTLEGGITLSALLTLLGCASYADVSTANAAIGEINVPFFNTTNNRIENTTSSS